MLDELIRERLRKLEEIRSAGIDPYPVQSPKHAPVARVLEEFEGSTEGKSATVNGRIMALRDQGGLVFLDLRDETGAIQAILKKEELPDFEFWKSVLDRGDLVSITGSLIITKRGEKSVSAVKLVMLAKSLRPLPTEHFGIEDEELRLRQRYLELILEPEAKEMFRKKTAFWETFRAILKEKGFLEVELPVLEPLPGGAEAEPFKTHHNALDTDFYLRISLELPLKKLLVGGYEKVFEIGRIFRNEGIDREHLQDYTQLEFYWAYHDYRDLMKHLRPMYQNVIQRTIGGLKTAYQGQEIDWSGEWPEVDYVKAFTEANDMDPVHASADDLRLKAEALGLSPEPSLGKGRLIDLIFKKTVRPTLVQPCFLINPPVEIEPLAKRLPSNPAQVERLQIMAGGTELGKGFSELNDPLDQRARFEEQMKLREAGDTEAQHLDEDFLEALEYGMPPAAGFGVSERLFAVLMDKPIREIQFFPLMRPKD